MGCNPAMPACVSLTLSVWISTRTIFPGARAGLEECVSVTSTFLGVKQSRVRIPYQCVGISSIVWEYTDPNTRCDLQICFQNPVWDSQCGEDFLCAHGGVFLAGHFRQ